MTRTGSTLALALALSLAALAAQGCCGGDDDDPTGGEVSLINSTPHFVHFFLPDEVFLYVQPGTTRTVNLDKDNSGRFLLAMAPGQGVKGTSEAFGTLCGCGSCGTVTAEWTYGQVVTNIQGGSACGGSSCPHVLAHDGERFVLQGEGLTGAINQGAQRADALVLPALRPMKGEYLVRLSTALPERDYIDSASLELIDHPPGSRIALDTEGSAHALAGIVRPLSAMDSAGADRLKEIAKRDGKAWVARKQGNAPSQRGTLELTF